MSPLQTVREYLSHWFYVFIIINENLRWLRKLLIRKMFLEYWTLLLRNKRRKMQFFILVKLCVNSLLALMYILGWVIFLPKKKLKNILEKVVWKCIFVVESTKSVHRTVHVESNCSKMSRKSRTSNSVKEPLFSCVVIVKIFHRSCCCYLIYLCLMCWKHF